MPHPKVTRFAANTGKTPGEIIPTLSNQPYQHVEVWQGEGWQPLDRSQSAEILQRRDAGSMRFAISIDGTTYDFNLDEMSAENPEHTKSAIRFSCFSAQGFETIRQTFKRLAVPEQGFGRELCITEESLFDHWPDVGDEELLRVTVEEVFQGMTLTNIKRVNMAEWVHYWALRLVEAPMPRVTDLHGRLQLLLQYDRQVLDRLQLLFEVTAESDGQQLSMSLEALLQVCQSLLICPHVLEQELAREVLDHHRGQPVEGHRLLYHDFLSIMLGRQRVPVSIWMYDISNGKANSWSWILGTHFRAFWHTAVVVDFPDGALEFWYGGRLYVSRPGSTPFGEPVEKRFMGYTYKNQEEVENHISYCLAHEFLPSNYDSLMHNCNHFSDRLLRHLIHQPLPHEILHQPEMIMNSTAILQIFRPLVNRWLGRVDDTSSAPATAEGAGSGSVPSLMPEVPLSPLALVSFALHDCGLESIGRVEAIEGDHCVVSTLDLWRGTLELTLQRKMVRQVLAASRARFLPGGLGRSSNVAHRCCWLPVLLPEVSKPSALSFKTVEEDPVHVANF